MIQTQDTKNTSKEALMAEAIEMVQSDNGKLPKMVKILFGPGKDDKGFVLLREENFDTFKETIQKIHGLEAGRKNVFFIGIAAGVFAMSLINVITYFIK